MPHKFRKVLRKGYSKTIRQPNYNMYAMLMKLTAVMVVKYLLPMEMECSPLSTYLASAAVWKLQPKLIQLPFIPMKLQHKLIHLNINIITGNCCSTRRRSYDMELVDLKTSLLGESMSVCCLTKSMPP